MADKHRVALVTLGCARNDVDSEELAARLRVGGFELSDDPDRADAVLVNTCGFIDAAKSESIQTLLAAAEPADGPEGRAGRAVVAVGCMAQRYGSELASALPEAAAVLGFDDYPEIADRVRDVLAGRRLPSHEPHDRRRRLPVTPVDRNHDGPKHVGPKHEGQGRTEPRPAWLRHRLTGGPVAPLKIASGCDRRCAFCAIPSFRGRFVSRPPDDVISEARWLAGRGVREVLLVSENSTSYGKDLPGLGGLPGLIAGLADVPGIERLRISYLQPAELRPDLIAAILGTERAANYFDLSFQHANAAVLRRMRRFGGSEHFLDLLSRIRAEDPDAGFRSNVIVGFPGESDSDLAELQEFLAAARLDAIGVFGYSDEEGTEAVGLDGHLDEVEIRARVEEVAGLAEELMSQRAQERVGEAVAVLVEAIEGAVAIGRAAHQGPGDGQSFVALPGPDPSVLRPGDVVRGIVRGSDGVDLRVEWAGIGAR